MNVISCMLKRIKEDATDTAKEIWGQRESIATFLAVVVSVILGVAWVVFVMDSCVNRFGRTGWSCLIALGICFSPVVVIMFLYYLYCVYKDCSQKVKE